MAYYLAPPSGAPPSIAPTCARKPRGIGTENGYANTNINGTVNGAHTSESIKEFANPTVLPKEILQGFHFTFLIRHPRYSIPSFFRCTTPPLDKMTGFYDFIPSEAGYSELRRLFDYLRSVGQIGPKVTGTNARSQQAGGNELNGSKNPNGHHDRVDICVIDADDLLDHPANVVSAFCDSVGLEYRESMLKWDTEEDHKQAKDAFEKWTGFHEDAMNSKDLKPRSHVSRAVLDSSFRTAALTVLYHQHKKPKSVEEEDAEWCEKFGEKGAKVIRATVNANTADYEYMKQFAMKA